MKQGAELIDARARQAADSEHFDLPSNTRIRQVEPGSLVKIGVTFPLNEGGIDGERFWVQVTRRDGDQFLGRIDNDLAATNTHWLQFNDEVAFYAHHILDTNTFDFLTSVDYVEPDEDEPSQFVIGVVGKYTRLWIRVGERDIGTVLGPGRQDLDRIIGALSEAREHLTTVADGRTDAWSK